MTVAFFLVVPVDLGVGLYLRREYRLPSPIVLWFLATSEVIPTKFVIVL